MIRVNISNEEALALFPCKEIERIKMMWQLIEDFKINLIEDGKSPKTIESYVGDTSAFVAFPESRGVDFTEE